MYYTFSPHTKFIGQRIVYKASCASTSTLAAQYLKKEQLPEGTVVITDHQYRGRGQRGKVWYSEPHKNLTFSVILYPSFLAVRQSFTLNILATLAVQDVLANYVPSGLFIKWPNDIYHQNKKLSGILIDSEVQRYKIKTSIIGVGLNVNQIRFTEQGPTSLALIFHRQFCLQKLFIQLLVALEDRYLQLRTKGLVPLQTVYFKKMYWIDEVHTFRDATHVFQGKIRGIDALGRLVIAHSDSTLHYYSNNEIAFLY